MWIRWYSVRHQDGRRNSGVGYNKSKWHWKTQRHHMACGREIGIEREASEHIPSGDVCRVCIKQWNKHSAARAFINRMAAGLVKEKKERESQDDSPAR